MAKIKIELKDIYMVIGVLISLLIMALCYLHREKVGGEVKFVPRVPGKEWWTIIGLLFMNLFMSKLVAKDKGTMIQHTCGVVVIALLLLGGVFEYVNINPGTQFWTLIGSVIGAWLGASKAGLAG